MNMTNTAKRRFLRAVIEGMQPLIDKLHAEVCEMKKRGVEFLADEKVKAAMESHLAMVCENQINGYHPHQYTTAWNPQTQWQSKETGAPPPQLGPSLPGTPPTPPDDCEESQSPEIEGAPPGYMYIHTPLPNAQILNLDAHAKDWKHNKADIPDWLTDDGPSTG